MGAIVLHEVLDTRLQVAVDSVFGKREDVLGRVFDLGMKAMAFDADRIHQERCEAEGHLGFMFLVAGLVLASQLLPRLLEICDARFQDYFSLIFRRFR